MAYTIKISFANNKEYKQPFETLPLAEEFFITAAITDCIQIIQQNAGSICIEILAPDGKCIKQFSAHLLNQ